MEIFIYIHIYFYKTKSIYYVSSLRTLVEGSYKVSQMSSAHDGTRSRNSRVKHVQLAVVVASEEITPLSRMLIRLRWRRRQHGGTLILGRAGG